MSALVGKFDTVDVNGGRTLEVISFQPDFIGLDVTDTSTYTQARNGRDHIIINMSARESKALRKMLKQAEKTMKSEGK